MVYVLRLRVKEVAQDKKISMNKLSQRSEVSYNIVKAIYRDPYRETAFHTIQRLAAVLECPPTDLLESVAENQAEEEMAQLQKKE